MQYLFPHHANRAVLGGHLDRDGLDEGAGEEEVGEGASTRQRDRREHVEHR